MAASSGLGATGTAPGNHGSAALRRLLADPDIAWLIDRVRERVASGRIPAGAPTSEGTALRGVVELRSPSAAQRAAAARLVGPAKRLTATLRIDLAEVETVLRRGPWPPGLVDAVVQLTGPVVNRRMARDDAATAWRHAASQLDAAVARFAGLDVWWHDWCAAGSLKRVARAEQNRTAPGGEPAELADTAAMLVAQAAAVLDALPSDGEPLAVLARRVTGDAHALDRTRPLGRLAVAIVGAAFPSGGVEASAGDLPRNLPRDLTDDLPRDVPGNLPDDLPRDVPGDLIGDPPRDLPGDGRAAWTEASAAPGAGASTRETWARAGVLVSTLTSTVLCLGVRGATPADRSSGGTQTFRGDGAPMDQVPLAGAVATTLEVMYRARSPVVLTLDQVRAGGIATAKAGEAVYVCENPTVVETAAVAWADGQPAGHKILVSTDGQPSHAVLALLRHLTSGGAVLHYHGDFDWWGLRIAQSLPCAWLPWRFSAADYREALARGGPAQPLVGAAAASPWDPDLAAAMSAGGQAVEEEAVLSDLIADLRVQ
jgi:uncharacterized protein (TIGR02679 family)